MSDEDKRLINNALITRFYEAFNRLDAEAMAACYTDDVVFSDPVFGELRGQQAGDMWRMLTSRAKDFSLTFDSVRADERTGAAHWVATYLFSKTGNTVINDIQARFGTAKSANITTSSTCGAGPVRHWVSKACCWVGRLLCRTPSVSRRRTVSRLGRQGVEPLIESRLSRQTDLLSCLKL